MGMDLAVLLVARFMPLISTLLTLSVLTLDLITVFAPRANAFLGKVKLELYFLL